jgi:hypothetical protein
VSRLTRVVPLDRPVVLLPLAALLCLAGGCDGAPPGEVVSAVRIDPCRPFVLVPDADASDAQRAGASEAVAAWNAVTVLRATLAPAGGAATSGGAGPSLPLRFRAAAAPSHGLFDPGSGEIFVNVDLAARPLAVTIAHELGHAVGLAHVSERASVMNVGNLDVEPNADDAAALVATWGACPSNDPAAPNP